MAVESSRGYTREDVWFGPVDEQCAAWLYRPDAETVERAGTEGEAGLPLVVLGQGFSLTRRDGLDAYAERFAAAGIAALAFDYRCFGESQGTPRQRFRIGMQEDDWRRAVEFGRERPGIDGGRVALWGYSFGGGHVVTLMAQGIGAAAAIVLCPFLAGLPRVMRTPLPAQARIVPRAIADAMGRHTTIPATGPPGSVGALSFEGEEEGLRDVVAADSRWRNRVSAGVFLAVPAYRPVRAAARIEAPIWVGQALADVTVHASSIRRLAKRAPRGELHRYPYDHFEPLVGSHVDRVATDQIDFLGRVGLVG